MNPPNKPFAYVLDDEQQIGAVVSQILTAAGFIARQFQSVVPFLAETNKNPPKLVVLDLALGETDAVEVMRQLEVIKFRGNLLLISGRDESILQKFKDIGKSRGLAMLPPLQKPFRAADLKRSLQAEAETSPAPEAQETASHAKAPVDLGEALRNRWLELWYQPKIDLKSLKVCGAEALLRASHPEKGILSPAQLLPPPADPMHQPVTAFVLQQALYDWRYLAEQGLFLRLAVNVPLSVLQLSDFIPAVREALPTDSAFPGLIFEVTEDEASRDSQLMREIAAQLKLYNIWLSIDDFGAGYSSLSRLRDLPCAEIKLDRSFVSGCSLDGGKQSLCSAAIELAHGFGATVCAEGVENVDELRTLIDMRCDTAQGFLFARPMPLRTLISALAPTATSNERPASVHRMATERPKLAMTA